MSRITSRMGTPVGSLICMGLAACSIPDTAFHPSADAGGSGGDAMASGLAIRPSGSSFDVDEGRTKDLPVQLTRAPSAELVVRVAAAALGSAARIGISLPELRFEPASFD